MPIWDIMGQTRLLRISDVCQRTSLSNSEIYRRIASGRFPKQQKLSPRVSVWKESDIENWINNQLSALCEELIG